jgi:hypothetical protein
MNIPLLGTAVQQDYVIARYIIIIIAQYTYVCRRRRINIRVNVTRSRVKTSAYKSGEALEDDQSGREKKSGKSETLGRAR